MGEPSPMRNSLAALALLGLLATACAGPSEPPPSSIPVLDKAEITAVEVNLKTDGELAGALIRVSATNDTVVLEGTVASEDAKARAQALALKVHGIHKVDNRLEVKPPQ